MRCAICRRSIPRDVSLGYHFCFGTLGGWPRFQPDDLSQTVKLANAFVAASGRAVDWIHIPVLDRSDDAFFAPLRELDPQGARVYLGAIHNMTRFKERSQPRANICRSSASAPIAASGESRYRHCRASSTTTLRRSRWRRRSELRLMSEIQPSADPRIADILHAGRIRVALYVPQYHKDPVTGALSGWPIDLVAALGERIGVQGVAVEHPNPADALESIVAARCDAGIIGIEAERATKLDYTAPLVEADYTLLGAGRLAVSNPGGRGSAGREDRRRAPSRFDHCARQDRQTRHAGLCRHARHDVRDLPWRRRRPVCFAARGAAPLRGASAGLTAVWRALRLQSHRHGGRERHAARLADLSGFVEDAKASGLVQRAIDRASWRGIRVAPPET